MADSEVELDDDAIDEALDRQMSYMRQRWLKESIRQYLQMTGMEKKNKRTNETICYSTS